ncbi:MAG: SDR family oxidoreductase [Nitrospira sp.]|nr:SDR family oxidoreductase [Nitrospira sp.]
MDDVIKCFQPDLFKDRHVLVTGGTSGIGLGIARGFARLGARVIATGSSEKKLAALKAGLSDGSLSFQRLDVRNVEEIRRVIGDFGRLDVLVTAAGIARPHDEFTDPVYDEVMEVNLNSVMRLAMAARSLLAKSHGSILSIASMLSYLADPNVPAYCASKTGLVGLVRSLSHAFGPEGIRVNAIAPGYHKTDMTRVHWENPPVAAKISERSALKRWGTVDDLVGAALFLSSPAARFITGATLPVDGGYGIG